MNDETRLHRQVHPNWIQQGQITSQVFTPTPKDNNKLSFYDGDQISAENSWSYYTKITGCESVGVVDVTVSECKEQGLDVILDGVPYKEHVLVDFSTRGTRSIKAIAKHLKLAAIKHGWQYRAEMTGENNPN